MTKLQFITACVVSAFITGCATPLEPNQVRITFNSEPVGAIIYDGEKAWGNAPVELVLTANESAMRIGYGDKRNMYAMWPSGAKSKKGVRVYFGKGSQQFTFSRPSDALGLEKDLAYAAQLRQIRASEEQASAASSAAFSQMLNSIQPKSPKPKSPTTTDCIAIGPSISCTTQ